MRNRFWLAVVGMVCVCGLAYARQGSDADKSVCVSNQKQLALGILMYVQDYDETFPIMTTPAHLQNRVYPYIKNRSIFTCPATHEAYQGNPALNYMSMAGIGSPSTMLLLRDAKPHKSDTEQPFWVVAYTDGHVKSVTKEPVLGKPAPMPKPLPRKTQIRTQLEALKQSRTQISKEIRSLEAELKRLKSQK